MRSVLIAGAGGATGLELCRAFKQRGWRTIGTGRDRTRLARELGDAVDEVVEVELTSIDSVRAALGPLTGVEALVYNAGRLDLAPLLETDPLTFEASWKTNAFGAFLCAHTLAASMVQARRGSMIFLGATASVKGSPRGHAFASSKHALRGLCSSLAKELGPQGVHVAHLVVDGKIWGERTRQRFPTSREEECLTPAAVAATVCMVIDQPRAAWTFELDLRPDVERWS